MLVRHTLVLFLSPLLMLLSLLLLLLLLGVLENNPLSLLFCWSICYPLRKLLLFHHPPQRLDRPCILLCL